MTPPVMPAAPPAAGKARLPRVTLLLLVAAAAMLAGRTATYLAMAVNAVRFPFELDYGEGIVWQQLRLMTAGRGYGPIEGLPSIVFHYPPLYHGITAGLAALTGADQLLVGRTVSFLATLTTAGLIASLSVRLAGSDHPKLAVRGSAALAAMLVLGMMPVELWSVFMRVDMLCMAFTFGGLLCGMAALTRPRAVYWAALLFVAAIYTKQTALAAPAAVFATLLLARPRTALAGITATIGLGLLVLAALTVATHGGFLRHIVFYNINRVDLGNLRLVQLNIGWHFAIVFGGIIGARQEFLRLLGSSAAGTAAGLRQLIVSDPAAARTTMTLLHLVGATLMLAMLAKSGAAENYLIEWDCLLALLAGLAVRDLAGGLLPMTGQSSGHKPGLALLIPWLLLAQLLLHPLPDLWSSRVLQVQGLNAQRLVTLVAAASKPVVSDNMVALLRAGKTVLIEPAIATELGANGVWNQAPLVEGIRARRFAFIVSGDPIDSIFFYRRHTPAVAAAIRANYPVTRAIGAYYIHLPAQPTS